MTYQKNVTFLEDLPDIDDIQDKVNKKYIRKFDNDVIPESGMYSHAKPSQQQYHQSYEQPNINAYKQPYEDYEENYENTYDNMSKASRGLNGSSTSANTINADELNCRDIANHIANCPVCSSLYGSNEKIFYFVIIVLIIVILMLINKLLEKM